MNISGQAEEFWIPSGEGRYCFIGRHRARRPADRRGAFIFCPPFAEEKNKSQRLLVEMARALAAIGFDVLRLDYAGTGDSPGSFERATLHTRLDDICRVVAYCRSALGEERVGLVGLRLGGTLAAAVAESDAHLNWLVLISPVANTEKDLDLLLRRRLVRRLFCVPPAAPDSEPHEVDGFPVTRQLRAEIAAFRLLERVREYDNAALILHASLTPRPPDDLVRLHGLYCRAGARVVRRTVFAEPFWNVHGVPEFSPIIRTVTGWADTHALRRSPRRRTSRGLEPPASPAIRAIIRPDGREEASTIPTPDGFISCIRHVPRDWKETRQVAIILVHGWAGYRIGPHRMLVKAARAFSQEGYLCLRPDLRGRGASSGALHDTDLRTIMEDVRRVIRNTRRHDAPDAVVVIGQCWGGSGAFCCGECDGVIMWSAPPVDVGIRGKVRRSLAMLRRYASRGRQVDTWRRLAIGRVNLRLVCETLVGHYASRSGRRSEPSAALPFTRKHLRPIGARRCLFVYGGKDPDTPGACAAYRALCREHGMPADFRVIPDADHSFYSIRAERRVLRETLRWLRLRFPARRRRRSST